MDERQAIYLSNSSKSSRQQANNVWNWVNNLCNEGRSGPSARTFPKTARWHRRCGELFWWRVCPVFVAVFLCASPAAAWKLVQTASDLPDLQRQAVQKGSRSRRTGVTMPTGRWRGRGLRGGEPGRGGGCTSTQPLAKYSTVREACWASALQSCERVPLFFPCL